jgi:hypothetical protein
MIRDYWIKELQNIKEFQEIADAEDSEIVALKTEITNMIDDQFIQTAMKNGIARREKMLKIQPFADDTINSRRFRVQSRWNDKLPYTYNQLLNKLNNLVGDDGYIITLNNLEYSLHIKINLGQKRMINDVSTVVQNIAPANLVITVELQYNRHIDLAAFTHQQLSGKTHLQLREEVLYS